MPGALLSGARIGSLLRVVGRNIRLIVARQLAHTAAPVRRRLHPHRPQTEIIFVSASRPDLNPQELLNKDLKLTALGRQRVATRDQISGVFRLFSG